MTLFLLLACQSQAEPPPAAPATPAAAAPTAPATPADPFARPPGDPCGGGSDFFRCPVKGGKEIRICGSADTHYWLTYTYGKPGAAELVFPDGRGGSGYEFVVEPVTTPSAEGNKAIFKNNDVTYEVSELTGAGGPNGAANNFAGVTVLQNGKVLATIACTSPPKTDWEKLALATIAGL